MSCHRACNNDRTIEIDTDINVNRRVYCTSGPVHSDVDLTPRYIVRLERIAGGVIMKLKTLPYHRKEIAERARDLLAHKWDLAVVEFWVIDGEDGGRCNDV